MFKFFQPTDWSFVTSGGAELTVGISKLAFVGGNVGAFYVKKERSPIYRLPYAGVVAGAGLAVSVAGPVSVSVSLPWAPGGGFRIYRNPLRQDKLELDDFSGSFMAISGTGGAWLANGSGTVLIFGAPTWLVTAVAVTATAAQFGALAAACEGVGVLWGTAVSSAAGVSAEGMRGEILTETLAEPGETGS